MMKTGWLVLCVLLCHFLLATSQIDNFSEEVNAQFEAAKKVYASVPVNHITSFSQLQQLISKHKTFFALIHFSPCDSSCDKLILTLRVINKFSEIPVGNIDLADSSFKKKIFNKYFHIFENVGFPTKQIPKLVKFYNGVASAYSGPAQMEKMVEYLKQWNQGTQQQSSRLEKIPKLQNLDQKYEFLEKNPFHIKLLVSTTNAKVLQQVNQLTTMIREEVSSVEVAHVETEKMQKLFKLKSNQLMIQIPLYEKQIISLTDTKDEVISSENLLKQFWKIKSKQKLDHLIGDQARTLLSSMEQLLVGIIDSGATLQDSKTNDFLTSLQQISHNFYSHNKRTVYVQEYVIKDYLVKQLQLEEISKPNLLFIDSSQNPSMEYLYDESTYGPFTKESMENWLQQVLQKKVMGVKGNTPKQQQPPPSTAFQIKQEL